MHVIAIAAWGAFFGTVGLMLAGAAAAYARSLHRVALTAGLSSLISALFVAAYLGLLPSVGPEARWRALAHVAVLTGGVLSQMLLAMVGMTRDRVMAARVRTGAWASVAGVLAVGWVLAPAQSFVLSSAAAVVVTTILLVMCVRGARRGDRLGWLAVFGVLSMLVAVIGMTWIALDREGVPWQVHAMSAISGVAFLSTMAVAMWIRYSYLIELREIVAHGPNYDPITRMRSHSDIGQMVGLAFFSQHEDDKRPVAVVAISIGNLPMLENLHGRAAVNHALFVCAGRLRRCVPADVEMGRVGQDGFLLLVRGACGKDRLMRLGQMLVERLSRPVVLSTSAAPADLEAGRAPWVAQVGIGVLATKAGERPSSALSLARDMSRTAWSYSSRIAWHDTESGRITELPVTGSA